MNTASRTFHLYRYQLSPTVEEQQLELFSSKEIITRDELLKRKNEFFATAIREIKEFTHPRAELTHKLYEIENFFVLRIGANRSLIRITEDFQEEKLDNWPSVYVIINNNPHVQMMAVELEQETFYRTSTVVNILLTCVNEQLKKYRLTLQILPTFANNEFWNIVKSHKHRITKAQFFMVAPNLADISKNLELDLEAIKSKTNSLRTNVSLQSPSGESLTLSEDDRFTSSMVHYAAEGGGTIHLKVRGIRKLIKTEDSIKFTEIDEIYFTGNNVPPQLIEQLRKVLS